eukprot:867762-Rhodomonas_salina.1
MEGNVAGTRGGAVYAGLRVSVIASSVVISENTAQDGGGIFATDGCELTLSGSVSVGNNAADQRGGGIYAYGDSTVYLSDGVRMEGNVAGTR